MNIIGAVTLRRKVQLHPIWRLPPYVLKFLIWCLIEANWRDELWYDGYQEIVIPRGSFVSTYREMAIACNLTVKEVRVASEHLVKLGIASFRAHSRAQLRAHIATVVTILNYNSLQAMGGDLRHSKGHSSGTARAQLGHSPPEKQAPIPAKPLHPNKTRGSPERPHKEEEEKKKRREEVSLSVVPTESLTDRLTEIYLLVKREGHRLAELPGSLLVAEIAAALGDAPVGYLEAQIQKRRRKVKSLGLLRNLAGDARRLWESQEQERARNAAKQAAHEQQSREAFDRMVEVRRAVLRDPQATVEQRRIAKEELDMWGVA